MSSKRSLISVIPALLLSEDTETVDGTKTINTQQIQKSDPEEDHLFTDLGPGLPTDSLGPVTERFMVVKRGMDVVLECRDSDGAEVLWRKQGGEKNIMHGSK